MKKPIISTILVLIMTVVVYHDQIWDYVKPNKMMNKEISLSIAPENNYTSAAYADAKATVNVVVTKVRGDKKTIVWNKTFDTIELQNYPRLNAAFNEKVKIPGVIDNKEKLIVTYIVTYDNKGSVLQLTNGEAVSTGVSTEKMMIGI
ncbi:hypothetical protein [Limnovirga soli]|jgi:hypothetical protein|uniref:Uncharacterized protein n=1 Tax=Limnovirga soli TaxID=2656915 RepID=A0A8J8FBC1_9BACT|nr:hypothetical protein [Limnovirga soli]NNV54432.1 hypothetical protein [Limnovirga soli]